MEHDRVAPNKGRQRRDHLRQIWHLNWGCGTRIGAKVWVFCTKLPHTVE
jgi:hypothetical protein